MTVKFRSDISTRPVEKNCTGSDRIVACAAWAEHPDSLGAGREDTPGGWRRTIRSCMRLKHTSPFDQGLLSVYLEAPGVVWWQLTRQRFMSLDAEDFSFNLESGRYKVLDPEFYLPPEGRPCLEPDGFKPMRPALGDDRAAWVKLTHNLRSECLSGWARYTCMVEGGVAREAARLVLPNWALYCDGYVTAKPLTWLQFFSKRNRTAETSVPTFPQWEIEQAARQMESLFAEMWPITHAAFNEFGRVMS